MDEEEIRSFFEKHIEQNRLGKYVASVRRLQDAALRSDTISYALPRLAKLGKPQVMRQLAEIEKDPAMRASAFAQIVITTKDKNDLVQARKEIELAHASVNPHYAGYVDELVTLYQASLDLWIAKGEQTDLDQTLRSVRLLDVFQATSAAAYAYIRIAEVSKWGKLYIKAATRAARLTDVPKMGFIFLALLQSLEGVIGSSVHVLKTFQSIVRNLPSKERKMFLALVGDRLYAGLLSYYVLRPAKKPAAQA